MAGASRKTFEGAVIKIRVLRSCQGHLRKVLGWDPQGQPLTAPPKGVDVCPNLIIPRVPNHLHGAFGVRQASTPTARLGVGWPGGQVTSAGARYSLARREDRIREISRSTAEDSWSGVIPSFAVAYSHLTRGCIGQGFRKGSGSIRQHCSLRSTGKPESGDQKAVSRIRSPF